MFRGLGVYLEGIYNVAIMGGYRIGSQDWGDLWGNRPSQEGPFNRARRRVKKVPL